MSTLASGKSKELSPTCEEKKNQMYILKFHNSYNPFTHFRYEYRVYLWVVSKVLEYLHSLLLWGLTVDEWTIQFHCVSAERKNHIREYHYLVVTSNG